ETGGETEQRHRGVFLAALPGGEAGVERVRPEPPAVTVDVLPARRRQGQRAREGAVRAGGVADLEIVAAQIVPGAGILLLLVLEDGFYEDPVRLRELAIALVGFFGGDRKSTRLNSSHVSISYAVFCLKKKN